jgi:hypothetical protein
MVDQKIQTQNHINEHKNQSDSHNSNWCTASPHEGDHRRSSRNNHRRAAASEDPTRAHLLGTHAPDRRRRRIRSRQPSPHLGCPAAEQSGPPPSPSKPQTTASHSHDHLDPSPPARRPHSWRCGRRLFLEHRDLEDVGAAAPDCCRWSHRQGVSGVCISRSMRSCCRCNHREDLGRRPWGDGLFRAACSGDLGAVWCR